VGNLPPAALDRRDPPHTAAAEVCILMRHSGQGARPDIVNTTSEIEQPLVVVQGVGDGHKMGTVLSDHQHTVHVCQN
jgi:hypothetical protein